MRPVRRHRAALLALVPTAALLLAADPPARAVPAHLAAGHGAAAPRADVATPVERGYRRRDLSTPPGWSWPWVADVDARGRAVGHVSGDWPGLALPVVWDAQGKHVVLPHPADSAYVKATDGRLRVVGAVADEDGTEHAGLWLDGKLRLLPPPGSTQSVASDVNRSGQVVGVAEVDDEHWPFVWSPATGHRYLAAPGSREPLDPDGLEIADDGTVAGSMRAPGPSVPWSTPRTAFRWTPGGGLVDLLAPHPDGVQYPHVVTRLLETGIVAVTAVDRPGLVESVKAWASLPEGGLVPLTLAGRATPAVDATRADVDDRGRLVVGAEMPWTRFPPRGEMTCWGDVQHLVWDRRGGQRLAPTPDLPCGGTPKATNDAGEIAGTRNLDEGGGAVYVWSPSHGAHTVTRDREVGDLVHLSESGSVVMLTSEQVSPGSYGMSVVDPTEGVVRQSAPAVADTSVAPGTGPLGTRPFVVGGRGAIGLLRFAVPPAPPGRSLVAATVHWWTTDEAGAGSVTPLEVRRVVGPWSQATTWADRPALGTRRLGVVGVVGAGEPLSVPLDPSEIPARGGSIDLALLGPAAEGIAIGSREAADPRRRPVIELVHR